MIAGLTRVVREARAMVPEWLMALFVLLRERWSARRDGQIRFLRLQVEILRSRLPGNRIIPDPAERRRLLQAGAEVVSSAPAGRPARSAGRGSSRSRSAS